MDTITLQELILWYNVKISETDSFSKKDKKVRQIVSLPNQPS